MSNILVSVIVPVYKVAAYLPKCMESIVNQTYKNIEIILVDDGSPDACPAICDAWAEKDARIRVIHQKNRGLSGARNTGIFAAQGDLIGFVDSDDYIAPDMYEKMVHAVQKHDADLCICGIRWENDDGSLFDNGIKSPITDELLTQNEAFHKLFGRDYFYYVTAVNKLYKREIFEGLCFPEGRLHEDEFTIHYIFDRCSSVVSVKEELYFYVQRKDSIMHAGYSIKQIDSVWAFYDRCCFFKEKGLYNLSRYAANQSYKRMMTCLNHADILKNRKEIATAFHTVLKVLFPDLRAVKLLLQYYKRLIREKFIFLKANWYLKKAFCNAKNGAVVMLATPTHGNLGDQAIVYAERELLMEFFPNKKIVEVPNSIYTKYTDIVARYISKQDIIVIDGGGNLGTLWSMEDDKITGIITRFSENKIVVFPQTCFYDRSTDSTTRLERNRKAYEAASDLTIMLRDEASYRFVCENFPKVKGVYLPDIVLSLYPKIEQNAREGVLLCFRQDCEKVVDDAVCDTIKKMLADANISVRDTSTLVPYGVSRKNRETELFKKWREFASSELVITDRLHAMIFAAITNTPCIAVDNKSKKVGGVYEWIKELPYIQYLESAEDISGTMLKMLNRELYQNFYQYPKSQLHDIFE